MLRVYRRGLPLMGSKAQFSWTMETSISEVAGTLTATGTKPRPQHEPGKRAFASSVPALRSLTVNSGLLPTGSQLLYSSPAAP